MSEAGKAVLMESKGDVTVLRFRADEITEQTLGPAYEELQGMAEALGGKVVFALGNVGFLSSAGISTLLWLSEQVRSQGGQFKLCNLKPAVLDVLKIGRLDTVLEIHESTEDAIEAFCE